MKETAAVKDTAKKEVSITLIDRYVGVGSEAEHMYTIKEITNTVKFHVGDMLREKDVQELLEQSHVTVHFVPDYE